MTNTLLTGFTTMTLLITNTGGILASDNHQLISEKQISLNNRQPDKGVNDVFKDNILLNLAYLEGSVNKDSLNWDNVRKNKGYSFTLKPGESFAYHENVFPEYKNSVVKTTNAHFNLEEGFKTDGYLVGDGVCHLASLFYWAAKTANLETKAPSSHDFADIPEVPKEYGVAIYNQPESPNVGQQQNLYIKNNKINPIKFTITFDGTTLKVSIFEVIN